MFGNIFDVSAIPTIAIGNVEVLADGFSALYGSDAIAGVVNLGLRKSFDGAEIRGRYTFGDDYDGQRLSAILGQGWDGGHVMIAGEYEHGSKQHGQRARADGERATEQGVLIARTGMRNSERGKIRVPSPGNFPRLGTRLIIHRDSDATAHRIAESAGWDMAEPFKYNLLCRACRQSDTAPEGKRAMPARSSNTATHNGPGLYFPERAGGRGPFRAMIEQIIPRRRVLGLLGPAAAALLLVPGTAWAEKPIATHSGLLLPAASEDGRVRIFKGIPYAAPPEGKLRWRPPEPPRPWTGVRTASAFGAPCYQGRFPHVADERPPSEDCLTLNIWAPPHPGGGKLPVMVWLHGGAFIAGSNTAHDGAPLAAKGVILVAINYRLGPMGFFTHPLLTAESSKHSSGNYALLDSIQALKWVKRNIAAFGGDPDNVTIFGQSAGSEMVNLLTVSPRARGLFARAIGESGGSLGWRQPRTLAQSEKLGLAIAGQLGATTLAQLRALPPEKLFELSGHQFEPVIDGWVYPIPQRHALREGIDAHVPMIVGSTSDEGQISPTLTAQKYRADAVRRFGARANAFLERFPARSDEEARQANKRVGTLDAEFIEDTIADAHSRVAPTYQYRFVHTPPPATVPGYGRNLQGAYHASELSYVFAKLAKEPRQWGLVDRMLEHHLTSYWVNFARTGDPNGPGLPHWPTVREAPGQVMQFGDKVEIVDRPNEDDVRFLGDLIYPTDAAAKP